MSYAQPSKVIKVTNTKKTGAYAPLTLEGTIVVDNAFASRYAVIDDTFVYVLVVCHDLASYNYVRFPNRELKSLKICSIAERF
jgi:hypothetical protein